MTQPANPSSILPFHVFRFRVEFEEAPLGSKSSNPLQAFALAQFSEVTGLEATMEPKVIRAGGRNYGSVQRCGPVTFATVILKRGITTERDLWTWFSTLGAGKYAYRMNVRVTLMSPLRESSGDPPDLYKWELERALPVKFKSADLNSKAPEVGIEELHLVHEGLRLIS